MSRDRCVRDICCTDTEVARTDLTSQQCRLLRSVMFMSVSFIAGTDFWTYFENIHTISCVIHHFQ